jgi:hypothetical protein
MLVVCGLEALRLRFVFELRRGALLPVDVVAHAEVNRLVHAATLTERIEVAALDDLAGLGFLTFAEQQRDVALSVGLADKARERPL